MWKPSLKFCITALLVGLSFFSQSPSSSALAAEKETGMVRVYFGTYTQGDSKGVYVSEFDPKTGKLSPAKLAVETTNPSFLALHPSGKFVVAVNETNEFQGKKNSGGVSSFSVNPEDGSLTLINQQPSGGGAPCHVVIDKKGRTALVANYHGGSVAAFPISKKGKLRQASSFVQHAGSSVNKQRQAGPHGHSINLDPKNNFAFAADLGLDKILIYKFDPQEKTLTANDPAFAKVTPGAGPRHFAFHPTGKFAYVINEMQSTVTAFRYNSKAGALETLQTISTIPADFAGNTSTAEVQVHNSGKFLYGSNRGHDSIAMYSIDQKTGKLTSLGNQAIGGKAPRNFGIDPTGKYLLAAGRLTNSVTVFKINADTGKLDPTDHKISVPVPVCVKFHVIE